MTNATKTNYFESMKNQYLKFLRSKNWDYQFTNGVNAEFHKANQIVKFNYNQLEKIGEFMYAAWWLGKLSTAEILETGFNTDLMPCGWRVEIEHGKRESAPYREELMDYVAKNI